MSESTKPARSDTQSTGHGHGHGHGHGRGHGHGDGEGGRPRHMLGIFGRIFNVHGAFEGKSVGRYDLIARTVGRGLYRRVAEDVALLAPNGGSVLDIGTGPGILLAEIAERRPDLTVTGIDISADMIDTAANNVARFGNRVTAQVGSASDIPGQAQAYDLIVTSFSLHHWDDIPAAVPELNRVLRPGGRVCVYDFPSGPFDELDAAARDAGLLDGAPISHTSLRTGTIHLRVCARHVLTAAG